MFDSIQKLLDKISLGEDSTIEFKERLDSKNRNSIADEIAAFANSNSGVILIGVNDNKNIIGIDLQNIDDCEKLIIEICHDSIEPPINIFTEKIPINDKIVLKIEIHKSLYVHKSPGGYFERSGSGKRELTTEKLSRKIQSRSQARIIHFDEQSVPKTNKSDLNPTLYEHIIGQHHDEGEIQDLLVNTSLLTEGDNSNLTATVAGILICSDEPRKYLNNSYVQAVHYNSKDQDANNQIDAQDFTGPLDKQIIDSFNFVKKHNQISASKDIGREDKPQYSMRAVFEAIVNAVMHRDYSIYASKIRLFLFKDRLEIYSPGELPNTVTIEKMRQKQATRNETLVGLLNRIPLTDNTKNDITRKHFFEMRGEGVGIILDESKNISGKFPKYELIGEELLLTIFAAH